MKSLIFATYFIVTVFATGAIAEQDTQHEKPKDWGFGSDVNGILLAAGVAGIGWAVRQSTVWGMKDRESKLKEEILKETTLLVTEKIAANQVLNDKNTVIELTGIKNELKGMGERILVLQSSFESYRLEMEKRLDRHDKEIARIDGNVHNLIPHLNQSLQQLGLYGVNPSQVKIRRGDIPSTPHDYQED